MLFGIVRARGDGGVRRGDRRHDVRDDVATRDIRELRSNKYNKSVPQRRAAQRCGPKPD